MNNIYISEETLHYAAAFLDRWEEKAPNSEHYRKAKKELRELSNHLLEHLYSPLHIAIIRHNKK